MVKPSSKKKVYRMKKGIEETISIKFDIAGVI